LFTILAKRGESYAYDVAIIRNEHGVELNLVFNATEDVGASAPTARAMSELC